MAILEMALRVDVARARTCTRTQYALIDAWCELLELAALPAAAAVNLAHCQWHFERAASGSLAEGCTL